MTGVQTCALPIWLHNMRTMNYQSARKQREKALETMEIYAPIAHRLGMHCTVIPTRKVTTKSVNAARILVIANCLRPYLVVCLAQIFIAQPFTRAVEPQQRRAHIQNLQRPGHGSAPRLRDVSNLILMILSLRLNQRKQKRKNKYLFKNALIEAFYLLCNN